MDEYKNAISNIVDSLRFLGKVLKGVSAWWNDHQEVIKQLLSGLLVFANWYGASEKMIDNQIVFTDVITEQLAERINNTDNVEKVVREYYFDNEQIKFEELFNRCIEYKQVSSFNNLFHQIRNAYENGDYEICCIALFTITDGLLSLVSNDNSTSYNNRMKTLRDKVDKRASLTDFDKRALTVYSAMYKFDKSVFAFSNFDSEETKIEGINRHWLLHGRTNKDYDEFDVLKVLLWIEALIIMDDYEKSSED
jgi:hypothetical protein